jgi:hypothetical protein
VFWCTKDDPLIKFSFARHIAGNEFHVPQISTIFQTVIKSTIIKYGRVLNLFFGSSQTDHWLSKYGHFKFWGAGVFPF